MASGNKVHKHTDAEQFILDFPYSHPSCLSRDFNYTSIDKLSLICHDHAFHGGQFTACVPWSCPPNPGTTTHAGRHLHRASPILETIMRLFGIQ